MRPELGLHLGTITDKHGRSFQQGTINAYVKAARALDQWTTQGGVEQDFTACDTATPKGARLGH
ncbi:hypothetical protein ACH4VX_20400 [Streptomyces sp. NPDC020731]|uniref:hypothetical protein n=1 Tax=Streptomyces sp. NPDC020731 TaxID=3365085 RepID=UPI0037A3E83F